MALFRIALAAAATLLLSAAPADAAKIVELWLTADRPDIKDKDEDAPTALRHFVQGWTINKDAKEDAGAVTIAYRPGAVSKAIKRRLQPGAEIVDIVMTDTDGDKAVNVTLDRCVVKSWSIDGAADASGGSNGAAAEMLTISFERIEID